MVIEEPVFFLDENLFQALRDFGRPGLKPPDAILSTKCMEERTVPVLDDERVGLQEWKRKNEIENEEE
jgi:hypothetical protein